MTWQDAQAQLSTDMDEEFGRTGIDFLPMKPGTGGPQSTSVADTSRNEVLNLCAVWSNRHASSDVFRNKPKGERFASINTDVSKANIYVSVDCRTVPIIKAGDHFKYGGKLYEVVDIRPDGSYRTRADLVLA